MVESKALSFVFISTTKIWNCGTRFPFIPDILWHLLNLCDLKLLHKNVLRIMSRLLQI